MSGVDLVQWLRDQLDEDERIARAATEGPWSVDNEEYAEAIYGPDHRTAVVGGGRWGGEASVFESTEDALHIAAHDPARVLREIDAKRRMIEAFERTSYGENTAPHEDMRNVSGAKVDSWRFALRLLALSYIDRPGYREEWRP